MDASGIAPRIEALLPSGARARQLAVRTLLLGMMLALADGRPAHLTRVHQALTALPEGEQRRLGVLADWKNGPHLLTYRQTEYTFGLVARRARQGRAGRAAVAGTAAACDDLLEASVPAEFKDASSSLAVDWTDLESFSRPPPRGTSDCADPEASWGHRKNNLRHDEDELFFGYYLSAAVTVPGEQGPPVPELARRMTLSSCRHDPVPAFTPVLTAMPADGIPLGDILADSGYSHRVPGNWAAPLRAAGAALVQDLHPHDRGPGAPTRARSSPTGTSTARHAPHPAGTRAAGPRRHPRAGRDHDAKTAEAARYKLGRLTADDEDGYHRVACPAAAGKVRCPLRPPSMTLDRDRPEILQPPQHPRPAAPSRPSPSRRTSWPRPRRNTTTRRPPGAAPTPAAPPPNASSPPPRTPPATTIARGWCRLTGLAPLMLFTAALLTVRNQRILTAWNARQEENTRRAAKGLPPKTRRRRRKTPPAHGPPLTRPAPAPPARSRDTTQREHARTRRHTARNSKKGRLRRPLNQPEPPRTTPRPERQTQT